MPVPSLPISIRCFAKFWKGYRGAGVVEGLRKKFGERMNKHDAVALIAFICFLAIAGLIKIGDLDSRVKQLESQWDRARATIAEHGVTLDGCR